MEMTQLSPWRQGGQGGAPPGLLECQGEMPVAGVASLPCPCSCWGLKRGQWNWEVWGWRGHQVAWGWVLCPMWSLQPRSPHPPSSRWQRGWSEPPSPGSALACVGLVGPLVRQELLGLGSCSCCPSWCSSCGPAVSDAAPSGLHGRCRSAQCHQRWLGLPWWLKGPRTGPPGDVFLCVLGSSSSCSARSRPGQWAPAWTLGRRTCWLGQSEELTKQCLVQLAQYSPQPTHTTHIPTLSGPWQTMLLFHLCYSPPQHGLLTRDGDMPDKDRMQEASHWE